MVLVVPDGKTFIYFLSIARSSGFSRLHFARRFSAESAPELAQLRTERPGSSSTLDRARQTHSPFSQVNNGPCRGRSTRTTTAPSSSSTHCLRNANLIGKGTGRRQDTQENFVCSQEPIANILALFPVPGQTSAPSHSAVLPLCFPPAFSTGSSHVVGGSLISLHHEEASYDNNGRRRSCKPLPGAGRART
jgi:hypothetical protein